MSSFIPGRPNEITQLLRGTPLFRALREDDLRLLAIVSRPEVAQPGQELYHQGENNQTLYIIASGQVQLTHTEPSGVIIERGMATTGQMLGESALLLAEPQEMTARALTDVVAVTFKRDTFMQLCEQYPQIWNRLTPSKGVAERLHIPRESLTPDQVDQIVQFLRGVPLFSSLTDDDLRVLVTIAQREVVRPGRDLYRQSDDDKTLYIIASGRVRLIHIDPDGTPTDAGFADAGRLLGETSLFLAEPHDVTALAITEVIALTFKRDSFMPLREQNPRMWGRLTLSDEVAKRLNAPHFGWQAPDEAVVVFTREHWWGLLRRMFFPLVALMGIVALLILIQQSLPQLLGIGVAIGMAILGGIVTYVYIDWRNDYWVVTNKRIVHVDEIVFIRKKRDETPLPAITQVQFSRHGFAAAIMDFGNLEVETFTGTIGMRNMPNPMSIRREIQDEVEKVQARERAAGRKGIRDDLQKRIIAKEEVEVVSPPAEEPPEPRPALSLGIFSYFFPKLVDDQGDVIIWRRHWIILWRKEVWSTLGLLVAIWICYNWYWGRPPLGGILQAGGWWIWPFILGGLAAWWWWVFEDWRNDEYMLTENRVIEIQRTPFSLNEQRRESPLSDFQSTELKVVGPWQKLFRYGTLIVKLPGAEIAFKDIVDPARAQTEITKRLNAYNARKSAQEAQARRNELTDWFAAYDEIRQRDRVRDTSAPPNT